MNITRVEIPFLLFLFLATIINICLCHGNLSSAGCIQSEREALLTFKNDLTDPSNRLASWSDDDGDCCRWSGITCDNLTGYVIELHLASVSAEEYYDPSLNGSYYYDYKMSGNYYDSYYYDYMLGGNVNPSLLNLTHLRYLDLSNNRFTEIPKFLGSMVSLRYLNLARSFYGVSIPPQLGNLSYIYYLNLHSCAESVEHVHWLSGLSSLKFLDLSFMSLSKATDRLMVMNSLPCLEELHLSGCQLSLVPSYLNVTFSSLSILDLSYNFIGSPALDLIQNMTSLRQLDLGYTELNSTIPSWLYGFGRLELLNLAGNELQGKISSAFGNMTSLTDLLLSGNKLDGGIPSSFKSLCNLRSLNLNGIKLKQEVHDIFTLLLPCVSNRLEKLYFSHCQLSGHLPNNIGQFRKLAYLDLSHNNLNGTLPVSFGELEELKSSILSYNSLKGDVTEFHFSKLTKLQRFYASGNQLRLRVDPNWNPPPYLRYIDLGNWKIGPEFPNWIHSLKHILFLNLSNTGIASTVPVWFWNLSSNISELNFSHNQLHGVIPNMLILPQGSEYLPRRIDLSSNSFQGTLPYMFSNAVALHLSNNSFSGPISKFLCHKMHEPRFLNFLDLRDNLLTGELPDCWMKWDRLNVINLNNNNLSGNIPRSIGALSSLQSLHLNNNSLTGEIPLSLRNCTELSILDLGENELGGNIPRWIGETFPSMAILSLRSNKFQGDIPVELCLMNYLSILDLAENNLSGTIIKCVNNFSEMVRKNVSIDMLPESPWSFYESMFLVMKGRMDGYSSILKFVRCIDLSKNKFSGEIPEEITSLKGLQSLNLSHNLLTGRIPTDIGAMESLEALDLSQNQLVGEIPQSMTKLTFLSHFNLSFNNFTGRIPTSTQLQSFDSFSFKGNKQLCGPPLTMNCSGDGKPPSTGGEREDDENNNGPEVNWFYVSMALGFVVGFWGAFGPLVFNRRWRHVYFRFLDNLWNNICESCRSCFLLTS